MYSPISIFLRRTLHSTNGIDSERSGVFQTHGSKKDDGVVKAAADDASSIEDTRPSSASEKSSLELCSHSHDRRDSCPLVLRLRLTVGWDARSAESSVVCDDFCAICYTVDV